jgi:hypothetical protein
VSAHSRHDHSWSRCNIEKSPTLPQVAVHMIHDVHAVNLVRQQMQWAAASQPLQHLSEQQWNNSRAHWKRSVRNLYTIVPELPFLPAFSSCSRGLTKFFDASHILVIKVVLHRTRSYVCRISRHCCQVCTHIKIELFISRELRIHGTGGLTIM